jgi:hypothetical protein
MSWSRLAAVLGVWAMLVALVVFELYPALPSTARGWLLLAVAGPPLYVAVELLAEKLLSREAGLRISAKRFSWKRVFVVVLALVAVASLAAVALRT